jgi:hypothetical protein
VVLYPLHNAPLPAALGSLAMPASSALLALLCRTTASARALGVVLAGAGLLAQLALVDCVPTATIRQSDEDACAGGKVDAGGQDLSCVVDCQSCSGELVGKTCGDVVPGSSGVLACKKDCSGFVTTRCCPAGKTPCGGACVILESDGDHCGACGHACGGDPCAMGRCQPTTMASGQNAPLGVAVDGTTLYWTNYSSPVSAANSAVRALPKGAPGSKPTDLDTSGTAPRGITIDPLTGSVLWGYVYQPATIRRYDLATKSVSTLVTGGELIFFTNGPTTDGTSIFFSRSDEGATPRTLTLVQADMAGNELASRLVGNEKTGGAFFALDTSHVYWTMVNTLGAEGGGVWRASRQALAGEATQISAADHTYAIAAQPSKEGGRLCFSTNPVATRGAMFVSDAEGNVETLADEQDNIGAATIDGGYCYWTGGTEETPGFVRRRRLDRSTPAETIAELPASSLGGIAIDEAFVYFAGRDVVMRVHK